MRFNGSALALFNVGQLVFQVFQFLRGVHPLDPHARACFVYEVYGFVGKLAIHDVASREVGRGHEGLVGDRDSVVSLVEIAQAFEYLYGVGDSGLIHADRLEAAFQGCVFFQIFAVFVGGGGADGLQFASGQHRLEDGRRVDSAFGGACAYEGVQLVYEQDDVASGGDLFEHFLEAVFKVAAIAAASHERAEVERVELLLADGFGHRVVGDLLGETFHDGCLAHAGLADEHRVVLGAAREHLHDSLRLAGSADDRIKLVVFGELGEVAPELVQDSRAGTRRLAPCGLGLASAGATAGSATSGAGIVGEQIDDFFANPREVGPQLGEHLGRHALAFADEPHQYVLGADVVVAELQSFSQREFQHFLSPGGERNVRAGLGLALADDLLHLRAHGLQGNAERLQSFGGHPVALVDEAQQDVLSAYVVVFEQTRFLLGKHNHSSSSVGESLEHVETPF